MAGERWVGVKAESSYGSPATLPPMRFLDGSGFDFTPRSGDELFEGYAERQPRRSARGGYDVEWTWDMVPDATEIGELLKAGFGTVLSTALGGGMFQHDFAPKTQDSRLNSLTIWQYLGVEPTSDDIQHDGAYVGRVSLEGAVKKPMLARFEGGSSKTNLVDLSAQSPSFSNNGILMFSGAVVTLDAVDISARVQAARFNFDNKPDPDSGYGFGSQFKRRATSDGFLASGEIDLLFENSDMLKRFFGSSSATSPTLLPGEFDILCRWLGPIVLGPSNHEVQVDLDKCVIDTSAMKMQQNKRLAQNLKFMARGGPGATNKVRLINNTASY